MTKTAWVFPGQGSQAIGMGMDLLELPEAMAKFEQAEPILGWSVIEVCQNQDDKVSHTLYTQPCLYVVESILVDLLKAKGQHPDYVAGHSLGEYSALYAAGVFGFEDGLRLIKRRAELMDSASDGMMAALLGFDRPQLERVLAKTSGVVLANDNNAGQVVISGTPEAVETVLTQVTSKRSIRLNISGAFHSPLMADAATQFKPVLDSVPFAAAQVPVLSNVDPTPSTDPAVLKDRLDRQMTGAVRWREISLQLPQEGVKRVVEVGPGKVLTGIIKRTCPDLMLENIGRFADLSS
ncbi:[acyl-carrier-protein] S-malonyltransferase [Phormidesmis priestleyi ULC007]|uniref:Malonyl CoA-acyl carrier protein transacylase n=1 Tax=Phormidesmis priestleyi ULC007 TaxID=1920490 RepID=A0A2T1DME9_9CYAN|nr:ACP S-malonyltransferase [Phormidesmis priestleyi]PSB21656.1 [acyl-carrier-protein] S-malonyltransferase [Phormidesmis priestleyi ULC007]PZO50779.1 MAG: [acyl-carrier-protein] S-malonyltransferase [Phormidesmis priestleyi]